MGTTKLGMVQELLKKTLKDNHLCCCAKDGSIQCRNCSMVDDMHAPREYNCPNCLGVAA